MALPLETLLARQKEVFNVFIANNGREVSIMPLVKKYSQEDGLIDTPYSYTKIFDYIKMYVNSDRITEEELAIYQGLLDVPEELKIKRGKEIVTFLIENRMNWKEVAILAKKYAMEDGRFLSYPAETMKEWRRIFLNQNQDEEIIKNYQAARELNRRRVSQEYDVLLLDKLLEFKSIEEAAKFIESINISRVSLMGLLDAYKVLFPTKQDETKRVQEIIDLAFKDTQAISKNFIQHTETKRQERVINFKALLEEFTISDIERIDTLYSKYNFTKYTFNETLKDMQVSNDKIISLLIDKYELKIATIINRRVEEVKQILSGLYNGINYNGAFHKLNFYDVKIITDMSIDELLWYAYKFSPRADYFKLKEFINNKTACRKYDTKEELFESVNYGQGGRMATDEEKLLVINFMEEQGWPYQTQLFMDTMSRYMMNLIDLDPLPDDLKEESPKMNK